MVVVCNAGTYRAVLAYAGSIANGIRSVVALDDDLHRSSIGITINICEGVDEAVRTAVVLRGGIGECAIRVDHYGAVLWIGMLGPDISAVIGQLIVERQAAADRSVLDGGGGVVIGHGDVVYAIYCDLYRSSIGITINIGDGVNEAVRTAVVLRRGIRECSIRVDHYCAVLWIGMLGPDISAVIGQLIVERQAAADRCVLDGGGGVVIGQGTIIGTIDKGELSTIVCTSPAFYAEGICSCYWIAILIQIDLTKINGWG